jgi:hypothetical protein
LQIRDDRRGNVSIIVIITLTPTPSLSRPSGEERREGRGEGGQDECRRVYKQAHTHTRARARAHEHTRTQVHSHPLAARGGREIGSRGGGATAKRGCIHSGRVFILARRARSCPWTKRLARRKPHFVSRKPPPLSLPPSPQPRARIMPQTSAARSAHARTPPPSHTTLHTPAQTLEHFTHSHALRRRNAQPPPPSQRGSTTLVHQKKAYQQRPSI